MLFMISTEICLVVILWRAYHSILCWTIQRLKRIFFLLLFVLSRAHSIVQFMLSWKSSKTKLVIAKLWILCFGVICQKFHSPKSFRYHSIAHHDTLVAHIFFLFNHTSSGQTNENRSAIQSNVLQPNRFFL